MQRLYMDLRTFWMCGGIAINPGLDPSVLDAVALARGITLDAQLREYLLTVDGMPGNMWDAEMIRFRPLREVVSVAEEYGIGSPRPWRLPKGLGDPASYLIFANYLISSHYYAVGNGGDVIWLCDDTLVRLADSFAGFIALYLDVPSLIVAPPIR